MKTLMLSTVAALFAAGTAYAADVVVTIDADADGRVTVEEWTAARTADDFKVFGDWDTDGDNILSRAEYEAGIQAQEDATVFATWDHHYVGWDKDGDGMLSQDEYNTGVWTVYDVDGDSIWNEDEMKAWEEDELRYDATRSGASVSKQ